VQWVSAPQNGVLTVNFDNSATAAPGLPTEGNAVASALLGILGGQGSQVASGMVGGSRAYFTSYGFFIDDTFQATRKLTITAGLRWDQPSVFSEASNNDTVFLPNQASPIGSIDNPVTGQTQQVMGNVALVNSPIGNHNEKTIYTGNCFRRASDSPTGSPTKLYCGGRMGSHIRPLRLARMT